jgi:pilus assembly protein CpaE
MLNCALITDDESLRRQVRGLLLKPETSARLVVEISESAADLARERVADVLAADPQVVFVDLGTGSTGVRVLEALSQEAPEMVLITAGPSLEAPELLQVIRAGASEYLPRPIGADDVEQAFMRSRRRVSGTRQEEAATRGVVTTLFSPKGGVGVTSLAANLAVSLQEMTGDSTILLDLSPSLGTAALTLGLQPRYSFLDVIQNFHRLDEELFQSFLEIHESGVRVLASPPRLGNPGGPTADEVAGLLRFCKRHFGYVVVDAGHSLTDAAEMSLLEADHRFWVSTPELPTLRNLKRTLELLGDMSANGKAPPRVILNQYEEGLGVTPDEVESGLGLGIESVVERDPSLLSESINIGRPAISIKRSSYSRSVSDMAARIAGPDQVRVQSSGGFLQSIFRPFRSSGMASPTKE